MTELSNSIQIDVRAIAPRDRHPLIFDTFDDLPDGGEILLTNDHDPVPLFHQFAADYTGQFFWEYLERGPELWRVRIAKGEFETPGFKPERRTGAPAAAPVSVEFAKPTELDVRPILARGETPCEAIDDAVTKLIPGQLLILTAPFEPIPLYIKLAAEGFDHQTSRTEDGAWRVEFRRTRPALKSSTNHGCSRH